MENHTQIQENSPILFVLVENNLSFGAKLKKWRKATGLTQEELAKAVGVHYSYISNLERDFSATTKSGKPKASEALSERLAKVLKVDVDEMRLAAGHAPTKLTIPAVLAQFDYSVLDEQDLLEIVSFIKYKIFVKSEKNPLPKEVVNKYNNPTENRYHNEQAPEAHETDVTAEDYDIYPNIQVDEKTGEIIHRGGKNAKKKPSGSPDRKANNHKD